MFDPTLYAITTEVPEMNRDHIETARLAIEGGATVVQFRDKTLERLPFLETAVRIFNLCYEKDVPLIINDRVEEAISLKAHGLHLGQSDTPIEAVREIVDHNLVIGLSVSSVEEALKAKEKGADYLGVGPIFETPSKADALDPIGCDTLKAVRAAVDLPLVAIGGINASNIEEVILSGADGIALISAIALADDMVRETKNIKKLIIEAKEKQNAL